MAFHGSQRSYTSGVNDDKKCRACTDFQTWAKQQKPANGEVLCIIMNSNFVIMPLSVGLCCLFTFYFRLCSSMTK